MNKKNTNYLFKTYPELFKHKNDLMNSLMGFGFECDDGWFKLIDNLCKDIYSFYKEHGDHKIPTHFYVEQVKEKYGGLRFYTTGCQGEVHDIIDKAELDSYYICEMCGDDIRNHVYNDGEYHSYYRDNLGWIRTLCDKCLKKHIKKLRNMVL